MKNKNLLILRKLISAALVVTFGLSMPVAPLGAQLLPNLPAPGQMVFLTPGFQPPVLRGMTVHPENPLLFDFIVDRGQDKINDDRLKEESTKLIKYFLASMTIPDKDAWVNLSPYEKDRIVPNALGQTEMGRQMLEQDYILKQLSASLTNPDKELGQKFWSEVRSRAQKQFGTTEIPLNTFNKVWIVPDGATVVEKDGFAYITESKLKVMLDEDYVAQNANPIARSPQGDVATSYSIASTEGARQSQPLSSPQSLSGDPLSRNGPPTKTFGGDSVGIGNDIQTLSTAVFREMILPKLVEEVNTGKNFAQTRQVYQSVILAAWYKKALKDSLLGRIYADKSKVEGVESDVKDIKQKVYDQYLEAFKKGVYNVIKEEDSPNGEDLIPRKYFSGGNIMDMSLPASALTIDTSVRGFQSAASSVTRDPNLSMVRAAGTETGERGVIARNVAANEALAIQSMTSTSNFPQRGNQVVLVGKETQFLFSLTRDEMIAGYNSGVIVRRDEGIRTKYEIIDGTVIEQINQLVSIINLSTDAPMLIHKDGVEKRVSVQDAMIDILNGFRVGPASFAGKMISGKTLVEMAQSVGNTRDAVFRLLQAMSREGNYRIAPDSVSYNEAWDVIADLLVAGGYDRNSLRFDLSIRSVAVTEVFDLTKLDSVFKSGSVENSDWNDFDGARAYLLNATAEYDKDQKAAQLAKEASVGANSDIATLRAAVDDPSTPEGKLHSHWVKLSGLADHQLYLNTLQQFSDNNQGDIRSLTKALVHFTQFNNGSVADEADLINLFSNVDNFIGRIGRYVGVGDNKYSAKERRMLLKIQPQIDAVVSHLRTLQNFTIAKESVIRDSILIPVAASSAVAESDIIASSPLDIPVDAPVLDVPEVATTVAEISKPSSPSRRKFVGYLFALSAPSLGNLLLPYNSLRAQTSSQNIKAQKLATNYLKDILDGIILLNVSNSAEDWRNVFRVDAQDADIVKETKRKYSELLSSDVLLNDFYQVFGKNMRAAIQKSGDRAWNNSVNIELAAMETMTPQERTEVFLQHSLPRYISLGVRARRSPNFETLQRILKKELMLLAENADKGLAVLLETLVDAANDLIKSGGNQKQINERFTNAATQINEYLKGKGYYLHINLNVNFGDKLNHLYIKSYHIEEYREVSVDGVNVKVALVKGIDNIVPTNTQGHTVKGQEFPVVFQDSIDVFVKKRNFIPENDSVSPDVRREIIALNQKQFAGMTDAQITQRFINGTVYHEARHFRDNQVRFNLYSDDIMEARAFAQEILSGDSPYYSLGQWAAFFGQGDIYDVAARTVFQHMVQKAKEILPPQSVPNEIRNLDGMFLRLPNSAVMAKTLQGLAKLDAKTLGKLADSFLRDTKKTASSGISDIRISDLSPAVSTTSVGGIDFDPSKLNLQIKRDGRGVPLPLPQQNLENININGLYPVIINIMPINIQTLPILSHVDVQLDVALSKS